MTIVYKLSLDSSENWINNDGELHNDVWLS